MLMSAAIGRSAASTAAAITPTPTIYTASTSITCPDGARKARLMATGSGGGPNTTGSGGTNGGASGGSTASGTYDIDPSWWGTTITITVGGSALANANGGNTVISWPAAGLTLTGTAGNKSTSGAGATGSAATGGQVNSTGGSGASASGGNDGGGGGAGAGLEFPAGGRGANSATNQAGAGGGGGVGAPGGDTLNTSQGYYTAGSQPSGSLRGPGSAGCAVAGGFTPASKGLGGGGAGGSGDRCDGGLAYVQFT